MLCRLYVDEVGNNDLKNATTNENVRFLSLTGITTFRHFHDENIQPVIDNLKAEYFGHTQDNPVILHRREMVDRVEPFEILNDDGVRAVFDERLLTLMDQLPYLVTTVTIDKKEHQERYQVWQYDPYHYCMCCLVERYVLWLNRHGWTGDVVAESRFKKVDKKLKASFMRTWHEGTDNIGPEIVQKRLTSRDLKLFEKDENCAGLQLCDLLAHPSYRAMRRLRDKEPIPDDFGGKVHQILEGKKLSRHPKTKVIDGWGRKWLP